MAIIGFVGESKSGKTSLIVEITKALSKRGYEVATIKHIADPDFTTIDTKGTDTYRHTNAGASLVVGASSDETAFILKDRLDFSNITNMIEEIVHPDIILVEGFKNEGNQKVALDKTDTKNVILEYDGDERKILDYIVREIEIERIYKRLPKLDCSKCGFDCKKMAKRIYEGEATFEDCVNRSEIKLNIKINGEALPLGKFVKKITRNTILGLISPLKDVERVETLEITYEGER
ncbi:MAG: molybdopterin-guanine dinucleotide biosynthesis protein B [Candidatus Methanolliviera hydrocarbonicum]|jgi:molybdopterin-guanine dinucleotide biosynthesis protein MobB|uniref:Molybdopterin-guanine dinucleotide biosynthesis protein B n=1 Tax=Candidatus Methanolliviera hydrocarbonicum TaxID=2491085 RepID=A0A520KVE9_9EURY|nr:MAG: molybdopterin-guanine dinucleotide biosynthesis protein B [Candidatus Methanolliviera hydrocarbonicum]